MHAVRLRDAMREATDDPGGLVRCFDEKTEAEVAPWYHAQIAADRMRFATIDALREGREPPEPRDELARQLLMLVNAAATDPDLFRAAIEYVGTITPIQEIMKRPAVIEGALAAKDLPPIQLPGPSREGLLELVR
jgi:hypothetical protein